MTARTNNGANLPLHFVRGVGGRQEQSAASTGLSGAGVKVFSNPGMSLKEEFAAGSFDGSLLE
jgi:hypothetical protein